MTHSLLYVSKSLIQFPEGASAVDDIVAVARERNAKLDVKGALISTPAYFAQVLEGNEAAVAELMVSILRDVRHTDVKIVQEVTTRGPTFDGWSMAYSGYATYVDRQIEPLFEAQGPGRAMLAARLIRLMWEFCN